MTSHPMWTGYWRTWAARRSETPSTLMCLTRCSKCGEMHHPNQHCSLSETRHICCHCLRRHEGGFEYNSSLQQQKEDCDVPGTQECPSVCYYPGKPWERDLDLAIILFSYLSKLPISSQIIILFIVLIIILWHIEF